jgi:hypothetical protein
LGSVVRVRVPGEAICQAWLVIFPLMWVLLMVMLLGVRKYWKRLVDRQIGSCGKRSGYRGGAL